ncbi:hypothetical protein LINPERHAP2_LOCUS3440 [Linum perenne]
MLLIGYLLHRGLHSWIPLLIDFLLVVWSICVPLDSIFLSSSTT